MQKERNERPKEGINTTGDESMKSEGTSLHDWTGFVGAGFTESHFSPSQMWGSDSQETLQLKFAENRSVANDLDARLADRTPLSSVLQPEAGKTLVRVQRIAQQNTALQHQLEPHKFLCSVWNGLGEDCDCGADDLNSAGVGVDTGVVCPFAGTSHVGIWCNKRSCQICQHQPPSQLDLREWAQHIVDMHRVECAEQVRNRPSLEVRIEQALREAYYAGVGGRSEEAELACDTSIGKSTEELAELFPKVFKPIEAWKMCTHAGVVSKDECPWCKEGEL